MAKTRVVVADDHAVLRSGLKLLINSQADMEVVGEAGDAGEVRRVCETLAPDVVTLDLNMPGGSSGKTIESLVRACPRTKVLVLTMYDDPAYMRAAMAAGAHGFVVKKAADVELLFAIRAVAQGRAFLNVDLTPRPNVELAARSAEVKSSPLDSLSEREREVLQLLALGHTNQEIAEKLIVSVKTVESYRARLMTKLNCQTRAELTRCAIEAGLLAPENRPAGE